VNLNIKKITAVVLAVIFLVGVLPYALTKLLGSNMHKNNLKVKMSLPDGTVKIIPLEDYLVGVVAAEMPAEFETEALKAQAVAARTYVLKKMGDRLTDNSYDVDTTEKTQAWNSNQEMFLKWGILDYLKYRGKIVRAVSETQGQIITFNGEKIDAVYHSSCGRKNTERAGDVWSGETSYLTNVPSGEVTPLRFVKHQIYDAGTFFKLLGFTQIPSAFTSSDILIIERTKAGRIKTLAIRNKIIQATDLRVKLQLPSTDFEWRIEDKRIELITYGKGHAVGMSQYGANDLAKAGRTYIEILGHYYPGTRLERAY
jgi:stage II sporulation protein D